MVGDIVWTPVNFTDLRDSKDRPVLVVADVGMRDWVICQITSRPRDRTGGITITRQDMLSGGITSDSWVRPGRLWTINQSLFSRPVARLSANKLNEVLTSVRNLF